MTPVCACILHRVDQSSLQTSPSSEVWGRGALPWQSLGLGLEERLRKTGRREQEREQASKQEGGRKYRNRGRDEHLKGPRNPKAWKRRERKGQRTEEVRQKKEGERKKSTGRPDKGLLRPLWFPSLFSALLLCGSWLLALPFVCQPGIPSSWQIAGPSSLVWSESDPHSARWATSAPLLGGENLPRICGTLVAELDLHP